MARKSGNKQQAEELRKLVEAVNQTNTLLQKQVGQNTEKKADDQKGKQERTKQAKARLAKAQANLAVNKLSNVALKGLKDAFASSLKLQQISLGRGLDLSKVMEATRGQQAQMAGSMTGFGTAVQIGYEQFEAGMRGSNAATNELALYTKLTGGNSKKMMKSMARLTRGMQLSDMQQTRLSSSIQGLSQNFGMTAEELMDSLQGLGKEMDNFRLMGVGAEMSEAGLAITAALGQEAGNMGNELLASIMSAEGIFSAQALGIGEERRLMMNKETATTENAMRLIEKAGEAASRKYNDAIAGGMDKAQAVAMITETYGKGIAQAAQVYMQLEARADELGTNVGALLRGVTQNNENNNKFLDTWANFKDQVLSPLTQAVYGLTEKLMAFVIEYKPLFIKIGQGLLALASLMAATGAIKGVAKGANYATGGLLKGIFSGMLKALKFVVPLIGKALLTALSAVPVIGWIAAGIATLIYIFRDEIGAFLMGIWEAVKPVAAFIWEGLSNVWHSITEYVGGVWETAKKGVNVIVNLGKLFWGGIKWLGNWIWDKIGPVLTGVWNVVSSIVGGIWDALTWVWESLKGFFDYIFSPFTGLLDALRSTWIGRQIFGDPEEGEGGAATAPGAVGQSRVNMAPVSIDNSRFIELEQKLAESESRMMAADSLEAMSAILEEQKQISLEMKEEVERQTAIAEGQAELTAEGNSDRRSQGPRPTQTANAGVGER